MFDHLSPLLLAQPSPRWEDLQPLLSSLLPRLIQAIFVLAIAVYLARWTRRTFLRATSKSKADINTRYLVARVLYIGVLFLGFATVLAIFDVPPGAVVTLVGVIGLGIGLALQDILKNFFAGLYLLFERPFRIGEDIRVKDFEGRVEDIGVRTTTLRTADNVQVLIPNAMVFAEVVLNRTYVRPASDAGEAAAGAPAATAAPGPEVPPTAAASSLPRRQAPPDDRRPSGPPPAAAP